MRSLVVYLSVVCLFTTMQACREGCTNPNAFNFDSKATSDDGGCIYCDTTWNIVESAPEISVYEYDVNKPEYGQEILRCLVRGYTPTMVGNACDKIQQQNCNRLSHTVQLQNLTNKKVVFSGEIIISYSNYQNLFDSYIQLDSIQIPAYSTYTSKRLLQDCYYINFSYNAGLENVILSY